MATTNVVVVVAKMVVGQGEEEKEVPLGDKEADMIGMKADDRGRVVLPLLPQQK
eukprot:CAMPEP_0170863876 /NCGR_PEP_ID=MMETSP0734-20130129/20057_1 /TAXON_ID=186038 /ORGANISM="Fragilariopsis kerguelensis, Strain L26-C5" /LENGTH=53 /DNA_ID=CAMNT_0011239205 /DNA_START=52 /DNA_END=213 /DNA_ORIENTATION=+